MARENGRFVLLDAPKSHPFYELINRTPEGPVFDIGVDLEQYNGVVYLKTEHVAEMAEQLGYISPVEASQLKQRVTDLEKEVEVLPLKIGKFTSELDDIVRRYHDDLFDTGNSSGVPADEESGEGKSEGSGESTDGALSTAGQIFGFDFSERSDDVPANSGDAGRSKSGAKG